MNDQRPDPAATTQVVVGRIGRPHGVRGAVSLRPTTDDPEDRFAVGAVLDTDPASAGPLTVTASRSNGTAWVLSFAGIDDRDAAESIRGVVLTVPVDALPPTDDPDEFYDHQLIGLTAVTGDGAALGVVDEVLHPPAAPVLSVRRPDGTTELVPFVSAIVPDVDLVAGRLTVIPPDGMFA